MAGNRIFGRRGLYFGMWEIGNLGNAMIGVSGPWCYWQ